MGRLGEQTNLIDGSDHEKIRAEQSNEYKALVESLSKG